MVGPTILQLAVMVLRQRRMVARVAIVLPLLVGSVLLIRGRTYTSSTTFLPASAEMPAAGMAGLAAQFGFALPSSVAGQSPDFYAELLQSQEILLKAVGASYTVSGGERGLFSRNTANVTGTLEQILEVARPSRPEAQQVAVRELRDLLAVSTGRQTGTVSLKVTTRWPELSYQLSSQLMQLVEDFNRTQRQSQASAERMFIEERQEIARTELQSAISALEAFLKENRSFAGSPALTFEHERLSQEVALRQRVVTGLTEAFEKARIEEVRNTPVVTIVENARVPVLPDRRGLALKTLLSLVGGVMLGVIVAFTREVMSASRYNDEPTSIELERLSRELMSDVLRPWRVLQPTPR